MLVTITERELARAQIGHLSSLITAYRKLVMGEVPIKQRKVEKARREGQDYVAGLEAKRHELAVARLELAERNPSKSFQGRLPEFRTAAQPLMPTPRIVSTGQ